MRLRPENNENKVSRYSLTQKVHPVVQIFGWVLRPQSFRRLRGNHTHFRAKNTELVQKTFAHLVSRHTQAYFGQYIGKYHKLYSISSIKLNVPGCNFQCTYRINLVSFKSLKNIDTWPNNRPN